MKTEDAPIYIVSGLPRSGTSMMMKILEAGGLQTMVDNIRTPDENNPRGYYELEAVKTIKKDHSWLAEARGKAIKIISKLLQALPTGYSYKIIFMKRRLEEIISSQETMLQREGKSAAVDGKKLAALYHNHLEEIEEWLSRQKNIEVLYVTYHEVIADPKTNLQLLNNFLDNCLIIEKMVRVVDNSLYRQRTDPGRVSDHQENTKISGNTVEENATAESNKKIEDQLKALGYM
ncbi:MAG: sulfotransferase [Proteobacteria bacterium]|nr:sulfotransferase [Pseudomonadota bacterium]MBU1710324.1 sulfotransferase [Pseudomonadota bacterium]